MLDQNMDHVEFELKDANGCNEPPSLESLIKKWSNVIGSICSDNGGD